jgi:hypothetical protein
MGTIVGIVVELLLVVCLLFSGGCSSRTSTSNPTIPPPVVTTTDMKTLDRKAIKLLLKNIVNSPAPKNLKQGATCYKTAMPPNRADYICPKCGERTLYDDSSLDWKQPNAHLKAHARDVLLYIPACRREFEQLRKITKDAIVFDESQFCRKCSPNTVNPKRMLHIFYSDGTKYDFENINSSDLRELHDLFEGKMVTKGENDSEFAMQQCLTQIQKVLGIKMETSEETPKEHGTKND